MSFFTKILKNVTNKTINSYSNQGNPSSPQQISQKIESVGDNFPIQIDLLKDIISKLQDGIVLLDEKKQVLLANTSAIKMIGHSLPDLLGKTVDDFLKDTPTLEITPIPISQSKSSILVLHDTTQEKAFEQMQIDFVSMASHEFRTPLTGIIDNLSVVEEESKDKLTTQQQEFLNRALISAKQLTALVDNILNVSKIERGTFSLSLKAIEWQKNLAEVVNNNRARALQKNITINVALPDKPIPNILADPIRINEVLNNLISNAITYTQEGGKIEVGAKLVDNEVISFIKDNGIGISKEATTHLFTKFFRVPGALEQNKNGSGLGLYLSKSIIDLHHGRIWVESQPNQGSTFYFSLPMTKESPSIVKLHS